MSTATCTKTGLSVSYSYKRGCRCRDCVSYKRSRRQYEDKERAREAARKWRELNPERSRHNAKRYQRLNPQKVLEWKLKKYGLTIQSYELLETQANGKCMICGSPPSGMTNGRRKRFHIDHSHESGEVRGLLCGACNVGLGHFKHDAVILQHAIEYLQRSEK